MSQGERDSGGNFLSRWSQRKSEAKLPAPDALEIVPADDAQSVLADTSAEPSAGEVDPPFDLSSLPKLEDLTGTTDITQFLRNGVPESLRNAALRRSWALDPAIRNYVSPALDYAFDWNTPGGVPGSSELAAGTDVAKMVLQIMGSTPSAEAVTPDTQAPDLLLQSVAVGAPDDLTALGASQNIAAELPSAAVRLTSIATLPPSTAEQEPAEPVRVSRNDSSGDSSVVAPQHQLRRHGAAKPRL